MSDKKIQYEFAEITKLFDAKNPDMVVEYKDFLAFNTGIYGDKTDNAMPQFLIDLQSYSSVHQDFVELKKSLILGKNLSAANETDETTVNDFIKRRNKTGDNLKAVYDKCSTDYSIFEGAYLQVLFDRNGYIADVYHVPFEDVRIGKPDSYGNITHFYVSKKWGKISNKYFKRANTSNSAVKVAAYNPSNYKKEPVQMIFMRKYSPSMYYPIPSYLSAANWIMIDFEIANFHLNNIRNNFFIAGMLTQAGDPTDEEKEDFINAFKSMYMGAGKINAAKNTVMFSWVDDMSSQKPEFTPFQSEKNDNLFKDLLTKARESIIAGHKGYEGLIFESKGADLNGDANKLNTQINAFKEIVTEPMKETLLGGFNLITQHNKLPELNVVTPPLKLNNPEPDVNDLTRDERREIIYGLPPVEDDTTDENIPNQ